MTFFNIYATDNAKQNFRIPLKNSSKTTRKQAVGHPNIAGKQILTFTLASRMANIRSIPILTPTQGTWTYIHKYFHINGFLHNQSTDMPEHESVIEHFVDSRPTVIKNNCEAFFSQLFLITVGLYGALKNGPK
jgi:hypothetical protein